MGLGSLFKAILTVAMVYETNKEELKAAGKVVKKVLKKKKKPQV